jgi:hypothetical protein
MSVGRHVRFVNGIVQAPRGPLGRLGVFRAVRCHLDRDEAFLAVAAVEGGPQDLEGGGDIGRGEVPIDVFDAASGREEAVDLIVVDV